ncbi:MAG: EFR1 family ferrodoxin [Clostridia bacterium]|nr:EFR1 family ferrodoxin [Clostridia bacterium]
MIGILYFSSTGNSLQIAKKVKERFGGSIIYIPKYQGDGSEFQKIFLVTPIYSFGLPTPVFDLLPRLDKDKELIAIQNYGGMAGGADALLFDYAKQFGLNIKGIYTLKMPENYTLFLSPPKFYTKSVLKSSDKRIEKILDKIANEDYFLPKSKVKIAKKETYLKNKGNWHLIGGRFSVNDNCVKCQKCVRICPSNNICLEDGKIVFKDNCIACLGCYQRCPQKAIVYLNKKSKYRYVNPNVSESEIGKDIK